MSKDRIQAEKEAAREFKRISDQINKQEISDERNRQKEALDARERQQSLANDRQFFDRIKETQQLERERQRNIPDLLDNRQQDSPIKETGPTTPSIEAFREQKKKLDAEIEEVLEDNRLFGEIAKQREIDLARKNAPSDLLSRIGDEQRKQRLDDDKSFLAAVEEQAAQKRAEDSKVPKFTPTPDSESTQ